MNGFLLSKAFRAGNLQGTPDVAGQWGSDWQESKREGPAAAASEQGERGRGVERRQPRGKVWVWRVLQRHGEGQGSSLSIAPNKNR